MCSNCKKDRCGCNPQSGIISRSNNFNFNAPPEEEHEKPKDGKDGKDGRDGENGKSFTFDDFTPEELESLKGKDGKDASLDDFVYDNPLPSKFSVGGVPLGSIFNMEKLKDLFDWIFYGRVDLSTQISFEVTVTAADVNKPIPLISLYSEEGGGQYSLTTSDGFSELRYVEQLIDKEIYDYNGDPITLHDGPVITHSWANPGVYGVTVSTTADVSGTRFTDYASTGNDRIGYDVVDNPYITKILKYKSETLKSLDYTFAGLSKCIPAEDFIVETPNVTSAYASFFKFGSRAWAASATLALSAWEFSPNLLSLCTKLKSLNGTFYLCNLRAIPQGFFNGLINVTTAYDTFKRSALGVYSYVDVPLEDYINMNLDGTSYIPMNLLQDMPNLRIIEGMFNAISATSRSGGGFTGANTSNSLGYGNWANFGILIKREFFHNGSNKGNAVGTIEYMDYVFGKINQAALQPDLFRHIAGSLKSAEGAFYELNWPLQDTTAQSLLFGYGTPTRKAEWFANTTLDVAKVININERVFPQCIRTMGMFSLSGYGQGLNGTYDVWGMEGSGETRTAGITDLFLLSLPSAFPAAVANLAPIAQSPTATSAVNGLSGMFYNMTMNGYASLTSYQVDATPENWDKVGKKIVTY